MAEQNQGPHRIREATPLEPGTTGRYVITFDPDSARQGLDALRRIGVVPDVVFEGAGDDVGAERLDDQEATIYFKGLGIVVAGGISGEQLQHIEAATEAVDNPLTSVQPERTSTTFSSSM